MVEIPGSNDSITNTLETKSMDYTCITNNQIAATKHSWVTSTEAIWLKRLIRCLHLISQNRGWTHATPSPSGIEQRERMVSNALLLIPKKRLQVGRSGLIEHITWKHYSAKKLQRYSYFSFGLAEWKHHYISSWPKTVCIDHRPLILQREDQSGLSALLERHGVVKLSAASNLTEICPVGRTWDLGLGTWDGLLYNCVWMCIYLVLS